MKFTESNTIRKLADSAALAEDQSLNWRLGTLELLEHVLEFHFDENGRANDLGREDPPKCWHCGWRI